MDQAAARSYLYVPGNVPGKLAKAGAAGADAVILDLEDSVPARDKATARRLTADALAAADLAAAYVRVNAESLRADIEAVCVPGLRGVVVPKAEVGLLVEVAGLLAQAERRLGLAEGSYAVIALIESAVGVLTAAQIAQCQRVVRLGIGEADLIGELGLRPGPARSELSGVRMQVVLASAAAGLLAPIGPAETSLAADADLRGSTQALLAAGFRARTAIHPRQLATINETFTPSPAEVLAAQRMIAALGDDGVAIDEHGRMVDAAVLRAAREVVARDRAFRLMEHK